MPAKDGLRGHDESGPAIPGHEPSEGGEEHPVETAKLRPPRLPLHHRELMAKNEDLGLAPASIALRRDPKGEAKDKVDDREEHRRILGGGGGRNPLGRLEAGGQRSTQNG